MKIAKKHSAYWDELGAVQSCDSFLATEKNEKYCYLWNVQECFVFRGWNGNWCKGSVLPFPITYICKSI